MKLCFFLQMVKGVPLGYEFSLYSYGPFDSDVLADLQTAEGLNAVSSETVYHPGGYGYAISRKDQAANVERLSAKFIDSHAEDIKWVADTFSHFNAVELELLSTIVFVFRQSSTASDDSLITRVNEVKPHFTRNKIADNVEWLKTRHIIG